MCTDTVKFGRNCFDSEIFFLFKGITCCWRTLKPVLHSGGYRQINVHMLYTLSSGQFLFLFSNIFFFEIYLSAILEIFIKIFSEIFFEAFVFCVVAVNTNMFYSCGDNIYAFLALVGSFFL